MLLIYSLIHMFSSSDTLHQDLIRCGNGLGFILSNQQCGIFFGHNLCVKSRNGFSNVE